MYKTYQVVTNVDCNLRCKYCYEKVKNKGKNNPETVKNYLISILSDKEVRDNIKDITLEFIGGESFLYPKDLTDYMETIISTCKEYKLRNLPNISIGTNGTLLDNEDVRTFIATYGRYLTFGISLDGTQICHDTNRVDIHGNGTYKKIIENLDFIK